MASSSSIPGVDMNNHFNLAWHTRLVQFKYDVSQDDVRFYGRDASEQRNLQAIAHALDLEYEYSRLTRCVTISKPDPSPSAQPEAEHEALIPPGDFSSLLNFETTVLPDELSFELDNILNNNPPINAADQDMNFGSGPADLSSRVLIDLSSNIQCRQQPEFQSQHQELMDHNMGTGPTALQLNNYPILNDLFPGVPGPLQNSTGTQITTEIDMFEEATKMRGPDFSLPEVRSQISIEPHPSSWKWDSVSGLSGPWDSTLAGLAPTPEDHELRSYFLTSPTSTGQAGIQDSFLTTSRSSTASQSQASSRAVSISSSQSERGRSHISKVFGRRSSTNSRASSNFREHVFDLNPQRSSSKTSGTSGRRGPLDPLVCAAANAVKAIKSSVQHRFSVRDLNTEMPQIYVCRRNEWQAHAMSVTETCNDPSKQMQLCALVNEYYKIVVEQRTLAIEYSRKIQNIAVDSSSGGVSLDPSWSAFIERVDGLLKHESVTAFHDPHPFPHILAPLDDCIFDIAWETLECTSSTHVLDHVENPHSLLILLRSAAFYQARLESDHLISQSLMCLRSCLEVLRITKDEMSHQMLGFTHAICENSPCNIECIASLEMHLNGYAVELSRVLLNKENTHSKSWWLSAFYSLCIQAFVRRGLIELMGHQATMSMDVGIKPASGYLHLAVRLFIACSGKYDPLRREIVLPKTDSFSAVELDMAQKVVGKEKWEKVGKDTSADYLLSLYDMLL
ncbi:hypothetical protein G7Y89_g11637 [Cudoniella acicularis]|uniref:Uncharacterized protein n=1 Tax=Cudoniella acicularis TaxID=354080 RepID=A0A8H4RC00_9HELO|nr:hypothetical protein G7Y89_g11637 [Cudoniella acicularis]